MAGSLRLECPSVPIPNKCNRNISISFDDSRSQHLLSGLDTCCMLIEPKHLLCTVLRAILLDGGIIGIRLIG